MPDSATVEPRGKTNGATHGRPAGDSLSREHWIDAAWDMLGEGGVDRVRVEPLAKKLGVTKGSFYWHFKDRQELVDALLDRWFAIWEADADPGLQSASGSDAAERIWDLFERVIRRETRGQTVSLRLWSHRDPEIAKRIDVQDGKRLAFFVEQLEELGFARDEAMTRSQVYQALISGEFLRNGGLPLSTRLRRAHHHHCFLVGRET